MNTCFLNCSSLNIDEASGLRPPAGSRTPSAAWQPGGRARSDPPGSSSPCAVSPAGGQAGSAGEQARCGSVFLCLLLLLRRCLGFGFALGLWALRCGGGLILSGRGALRHLLRAAALLLWARPRPAWGQPAVSLRPALGGHLGGHLGAASLRWLRPTSPTLRPSPISSSCSVSFARGHVFFLGIECE